MTIVHSNGEIPEGAGAFVFAELGGFTCSVCAPDDMDAAAVEAFAAAELGTPIGGWEAVDKAAIGMGSATPNPCNSAAGRKHWFLLAGLQAASFGLETKK
jgi:hypothetical protein